MIEQWQKAWVAGIIDFKGHIYAKNNHQRAAGSHQIVLSVETSIPEIAERLCGLTGSNPESKPQRNLRDDWLRRGCSDHCPEAHVHMRDVNMPDVTKWSVTGAALAIVLWNLRPYMTTDRVPWDWGMSQSLSQLRMTGQGSAAIIKAAKRLHGLGWDLPPVMQHLTPKALEKAG